MNTRSTTVEASGPPAASLASKASVASTTAEAAPRPGSIDTTDDATRRFQALADEKRLRILALLRGGERCVCELVDAVGSQQSLLSFHLKTLRDAGLVRGRKQGRWIYYSLERDALAGMRDLLDAVLDENPETEHPVVEACCRIDCCD